jgi:hypothetical protein
MKKKGTLPKDFQGMLKKLKLLNDELGITIRPYSKKTEKEAREQAKKEERKTLLGEIWQAWPRRTVLSRDALQMRGNALKNPEVEALLKKTDSRIEDCALIDVWGEEHIGQQWDCPANCSPEDIRRSLTDKTFGFKNRWQLFNRYEWGGPKDPIKILFEKSANNRFKIVGIIQMLGEKYEKRAG